LVSILEHIAASKPVGQVVRADEAHSVQNLAAHACTDVVRAHLSALHLTGDKAEQIEDILVTFDTELHLIRPLNRRVHEGLFLVLILDRERARPDLVRRELRGIEVLL
jgi:hypothetical protein